MRLSSGVFDRRITIQLNTPVPDDAGDPIPNWSDLVDRWARFLPGPVQEGVGANQVLRSGDVIWVLRDDTESRTFFPETHRIVHKGRIYEIVGIDESMAREDGLRFTTAFRPDGRGARGPIDGAQG